MSKQVSICVLGSGYVGLVAAVCFAEIGHKVICVDNNEAKVKTLNEGGVPIYEGHLPELLKKHHGRGVEFTGDLCGGIVSDFLLKHTGRLRFSRCIVSKT